jgi:hypothetical protein
VSDLRKTRGTAPIMTMSAFENAHEQFRQAVDVLGLTKNRAATIKDPRAAFIVGIQRVTRTAELRGHYA